MVVANRLYVHVCGCILAHIRTLRRIEVMGAISDSSRFTVAHKKTVGLVPRLDGSSSVDTLVVALVRPRYLNSWEGLVMCPPRLAGLASLPT